jgi:hypothetical protein
MRSINAAPSRLRTVSGLLVTLLSTVFSSDSHGQFTSGSG